MTSKNVKRTALAACILALGTTGWSSSDATEKAAPPAIRLTNYTSGTVIRHPVPLVRGELADTAATSITLLNTSSDRPTRRMTGLAHKGRFKVLAELVPGENKLLLEAGKDQLPLVLVYKPQTNSRVVRVIYMTDKAGDTKYQTPLADDPQDYVDKLDTAMKLMQTMTAERLYDLGFGRRTFNLELDDRGKVKVHTYRGKLAAADYYELDRQAWWRQIGREVEADFPTRNGKNLVIPAYTRFDAQKGKGFGHAALGGGGLALFGSPNLFAWPSSLTLAQQAFMDDRPIDPKKTYSDSAGRRTFWGATATTMGASLHELGHTLNLPHTREPQDIMTRGFCRFNRVFTFVDPPCHNRKTPLAFTDDKVACFPPISAAALVTSPWLAMDECEPGRWTRMQVRLDEKTDSLVVQCPGGVRYVGVSVGGAAVFFQAPPVDAPAPKKMIVPLLEVRQAADAEDLYVRAIDAHGHMTVLPLKNVPREKEPLGRRPLSP